MSLIKSISGIRGTIGGPAGEGLTPIDIVKFTYAYCTKLRERRPHADGSRYKVVVGKDARLSGEMVEQLVCGTLVACGVDVVKAGYASTPTTEMAVVFAKAERQERKKLNKLCDWKLYQAVSRTKTRHKKNFIQNLGQGDFSSNDVKIIVYFKSELKIYYIK